MRPILLPVMLAFCSAVGSCIFAEDPVFDSIEYDDPSRYLEIAESLGDQEAITKQSLKLKSTDDRKTLANVIRWMGTNLRYDGERAYQWRNYDDVVRESCYGGCADQAIVCGVLLKSAGIPAVWVKTMDVDWIWDFKKKRKFKSWSGHVFLEVYLDDQWVLLDPGAAKTYENYSPKSRILPGNRLAYHKGNDPQAMVMSLQWEQWKDQTASYFDGLDESLLPVDIGSAVDVKKKCYIIANGPHYKTFGEIAHRNGITVGPSFNFKYDKFLPQAAGRLILIQTNNGIPIVDVGILKGYFPSVSDGKQKGKVIDGDTRLVFIDVVNASLKEQTSQIAAEGPDELKQ